MCVYGADEVGISKVKELSSTIQCNMEGHESRLDSSKMNIEHSYMM